MGLIKKEMQQSKISQATINREENMQTPYYVIDKTELDFNFLKLKNALEKHWNNFIIGYSYKTNALPWIVKEFDRKGCFAEVVSEDEYELAKTVGVRKNQVIYNGPIKTKESFLEALISGAIVNIDSQREIEWLNELPQGSFNVGVRVNYDIEKMCPGQSQCPSDGGRFGFCYENGELKKAIDSIRKKGFDVFSLHLHVSSKTRGLDIYDSISRLACVLKKEFDLKLKYIDVGGGFFGGLPTKPSFEKYISLISSNLSDVFSPEETTLVVEPGMALIGACVDYVSTVIDVKDTSYNRFVITDGTRTSIDPLMTKSSYFYELESKNEEIMDKQIICGYTCMEHDRLFVLSNDRKLSVGDKITYHKVGAYTMCLTPLFIKYFPDVYLRENGALTKVREKWTANEYIQKSRY